MQRVSDVSLVAVGVQQGLPDLPSLDFLGHSTQRIGERAGPVDPPRLTTGVGGAA